MKLFKKNIIGGAFCFLLIAVNSQETEIIYLSGTGNDNTIDWEFYCTGGRNSGNWTTIPVPSNWELEGFGKYDYGYAKDSVRGKEKGIYKHSFMVPSTWKGKTINIVFEGSMTDTEVRINGKLAGPVHQGAYYRFKYNISDLLKYEDENQLEVTVSKHSENMSVNKAEREGDFWIFGGIFRPVYLEVKPKQHIQQIAINAQANGSFKAKLFLDSINKKGQINLIFLSINGEPVSEEETFKFNKGDSVVMIETKLENPTLWSPEFPNLYYAKFELILQNNVVHEMRERFGFRTVELKERDGLYLNGKKIKFKGVNRHSFWPESGRTTSKTLSIQDALLVKDMNMNAVRNAHYPSDEHFLDACDSLGIMVMDELAGWHDAYDTKTGTKLIKEMLASNMNHPSIVIWANGNEGGHNYKLDAVFDQEDIQKRPVCHPWEDFRGMDTQHYINYDYGNGTHFHGHHVVFPTEFLHGLYDGGHGAGLYDYWEYMWKHPFSAGGFLWDFSDGGIVRTDKNGIIDTDGDHAADGIMGPYREKEGSYYTIKKVWSPVFFEQREITESFDGKFIIENRYSFTNINQCKFIGKLTRISAPDKAEIINEEIINIEPPDIAPGNKGILEINMPDNWNEYDILYIVAKDPENREIFTWSWPISLPHKIADKLVLKAGEKPRFSLRDTILSIVTANISIEFNTKTGLLSKVQNNKGEIPFNNGPVLCDGVFDFKGIETLYDGDTLVLEYMVGKESNYKEMRWLIYPSGWMALDFSYRPSDYDFDMLGVSFSYPEELITGITWMGNGPYRVWKNRIRGNSLGVWEKEYNNTITGCKDFIYPEFKGYHSNLYWVKFITKEQPFTVVSAYEDIFLRLFTPGFPEKSYNTAPVFPSGDISFMHGIPPIGTKSQVAENMGPSGRKNMYFDYWKARAKNMTLYFDFSGE